MAITPEREPSAKLPEGVTEIPHAPEIPPELERATGIQTTTTQQAVPQVTDDQGKPLIQASGGDQTVVPASQTQLTTWSKGSSTDSLTWLATFWLRFIKKAIHFGWNVVNQGGK